jgi:LacI family transcriptional regulator, galactose operon repressor
MTARRASTLTEVARRAGVSLTTASKAINGQGRVSETTRARVLAAARDLTFTPNPMARSLISGRSGTVGVIFMDSLTERFVVPVMLGAEAALSEVDLSMIIGDATGGAEGLGAQMKIMQRRKVDGLLVVGDNNVPTPSLGERWGVPVVYVHGDTDAPADVVHVPDDRGHGMLVAGHLVGLGRRRIAQVTGPQGARAVEERVAGVSGLLADAGHRPVAPALHGPWSQRWGGAAVRRLLGAVPDLDAIACGSDQIAAGVVDALRVGGRRVPDDVAVTGVDNWSVFDLETQPPLTTVDLSLEAMGAGAVRDLFDVIEGEPGVGGTRLHPGKLIVRGSTVLAG